MNTNPTPYAQAWSAALKAGRKRKSMSRKELAAHLGVTYQAVQSWELGSTQPSPRHQALLVVLFGISPKEWTAIALKAGAEVDAA